MNKIVVRRHTDYCVIQPWWKKKKMVGWMGWMNTRRGGEEGKRKQSGQTGEEK